VAGAPVHNRISRFTADPAHPDLALPGSEHVIFDLDPATTNQHVGGAIHFGLDGKLYVGVGDDNHPSNAQDLSNLFGKVLRINPDGSVPADNPLVGAPGARPEIWAWGFRNPFAFAVQPGTGRIYVNNVGSDEPARREEVNLLTKGGNYGWPTYEGYSDVPGYQSPVFAYDSSFAGGNCAITGGVFYDPPVSQFPAGYAGKYFFTDLCGKWNYQLDPDAPDPKATVTPFASGLAGLPVDLKVGPDGRLSVLSFGGLLYRISAFATTTTLTSSAPTSSPGQSVTFTATVTPTDPSLGTPTGQVTFADRGIPLATVGLTGGVAEFATAALAPGNHSVTASYSGAPPGGAPLSPSTSNTVGQVVRAGASLFALGGAPGLVQVRRVMDGTLAFEFAPFGGTFTGRVSVALGDVNDDGYQDLVTAAQTGNPHVRVYDGKALASGHFDAAASLLAQWFAYGLNLDVGANVAVGDVNNDGFADVVTGATVGNPDVRVYNGKDIAAGSFSSSGSVLVQFFAYGLNFNIGANVAAGDVDGDGFADVITGTTAGNPDVHAYTGRDVAAGAFNSVNSRIASWFAFGLSLNVGATVAVGDTNGDGFNDVIAGASAGSPAVRVFSGRDLAADAYGSASPSVLADFFAYGLQSHVGASVGAADFDGDGRADVLTGAAQGSPHFRVVPGNASGIQPFALDGIDALAASLVGGLNVSA
jgi:hypothetical protein